jgi:urease subunit alpha
LRSCSVGARAEARNPSRAPARARPSGRESLPAIKGCRTAKKQHVVHKIARPVIHIDAQTYEVRADGQLLTRDPATVLRMAQRYFLF